jgi:hypothetical protein
MPSKLSEDKDQYHKIVTMNPGLSYSTPMPWYQYMDSLEACLVAVLEILSTVAVEGVLVLWTWVATWWAEIPRG